MDAPDVIAALATVPGPSALAVVRVAGPGSVGLVASRFSTRKDGEANPALATAAGHTAHAGWIVDGAGRRVDQVVCTVFRAPRSATGDETVEVTTHGGSAAPQAVLRALLDAGARPARPGEFTERAFLAGKLDLAQAEATADLIHAASERGRRVAVAHLAGAASHAVGRVREALVGAAALVALELDFTDEDVSGGGTFADRTDLAARLDAAAHDLDGLLSTARLGALVRDGLRVAILGRPNAGKSTLLNALVGRERAIVSDTPGTTRDTVEAEAEWDGLLVRLTDTAGLRETADAVEAEGTRRARQAALDADVLLYVAAQPEGFLAADEAALAEIAAARPDLPVLRVASKADLVPPTMGALAVSAPDGTGLDALRAAVLAAAGVRSAEESDVAVNERTRRHLADARSALSRAQATLVSGTPADLLALDLRDALHALGLVTGAVTADDVLSAVFSRFCIGK